MKSWIVMLILLGGSGSAMAWNVDCKRSGSVQHCHSWFIEEHRASGSQTRMRIAFLIRGSEVDTESVCQQYQRRSLESRRCLRKASEMFRELCSRDGKRSDLSPQRKTLYCDASRRFVPLR
ncbi:MAG: hypothetical protein K0A95_05475 [Chromatiales bacterium]|nr:hypothetical protein [Gammaproteobacteria bacterium]MBW6476507.1 hypothetical protein [Chromatiales bacterium]